MKKRFISAAGAVLLLFVCCFGLFACGEEEKPDDIKVFGSVDGSIYVYSNSAIKDCSIVDFDTSKYDIEEYSDLLEEDIDLFNEDMPFTPQEGNEGKKTEKPTQPVAISSIEAKDNQMTLQLLYATPADFFAWQKHYDEKAFNERGGSVIESGSLQDDPSVQELSFIDREGEPLDMEKLLKNKKIESVYYVTIDVGCILYSEGNILAYTAGADLDSENNNFRVQGGQKITVLYQ